MILLKTCLILIEYLIKIYLKLNILFQFQNLNKKDNDNCKRRRIYEGL